MNEQFARRIGKLANLNLKMEAPSDCIVNLVHHSFLLDSKINGLSEKESVDMLLSNNAGDKKDQLSIGLMYHALTSYDNAEMYQKTIKMMIGAGLDYWHTILCNLNMVLYEIWPVVQEGCKDQLLLVVREGIRLNVTKIENVLMNVVRNINGTGDWSSKVRLASAISSIIAEHENWLMGLKSCYGLASILVVTFSHLIVDAPVPMTQQDTFRSALINCVAWLLRKRGPDCLVLGRDLLMILIRLAKIPQFEAIWKEFMDNPKMFGVSGVEDMLLRANGFVNYRLSLELQRKVEFLVTSVRGINKHWEWLAQAHLRGPDGGSLRAEIIRFLVGYNSKDFQQHMAETRVQLLHVIISTAASGAEQQWCKCALWIDWLGYDPATSEFRVIDCAIGTVKYALNMTPSPLGAAPPVVPLSACAPLGNSLLEYVCKSATVFLPVAVETVHRSLYFAMRVIADSYGPMVSMTLEHPRIDRKVHEMMREVWKDLIRGAAPQNANPNSGHRNNSSPSKKRKLDDDPDVILLEEEKAPTIGNKINNVHRKRAIDKEDSANVEVDLQSSLNLLKGECRTRLETLKNQYNKDLNEDSERSEFVDNFLQLVIKNDDKLDDAQFEIIGQCLLMIFGNIVEGDESILPEPETKEKVAESFAHPMFTVMRTLCFTPSEDASETMLNIVAGMRERDSTVSYLLLYYVKGTITNSSTIDEGLEAYKNLAAACNFSVDAMLVSDLQLCALQDARLFTFLLPFVFQNFPDVASTSSSLLEVLCSNIDGRQLKHFVGEIVRENIKLFRKETLSSMVMASLEWPTVSQWVFWSLFNAEGPSADWLTAVLPKLDASKHEEAITHLLLIFKNMDKEAWPGLIRAIFSRTPNKDDSFTVDVLKVLIDESDQCVRVAELVGGLIKKLIANNEIIFQNHSAKMQNRKGPVKVYLQQVLEHLMMFSEMCLTKEKKVSETFLAKNYMQDAFASIKVCEKASMLKSRFEQLFTIMDILGEDKEQTSSRTLRGNRQGSAAMTSSSEKAHKRKATDEDDSSGTQQNKKKRAHKEIIQIDSSDSD